MKRLVLLVLAIAAVAGCNGGGTSDDGLSSKEKETASRVDKIAKESGGDWSKVSQADKDYLVKDVSMGSEKSAQMLLQSKAGKLAGSGGPPKR